MCGIAGIVSESKSFNITQWLCKASDILKHRGNDDDGICLFNHERFYCSKLHHPLSEKTELKYLVYTPLENIPKNHFSVGLLHRRLSIIDLSEHGHQPMCDETGMVWITYNGEVYNYIELRETLKQKGFSFFSNTDTEVILKAYMYYGKSFVNQLNGMWAFCIYDKRTNEFFLSRDRVGVKPLYYCYSKDVFAFASEQKVFIKSKLLRFEISYEAVSKYMVDNILEDDENGIIKGIKELQPGENIVVDIKNLSVRKEKYFDIRKPKEHSAKIVGEKEIINYTKYFVDKSIREHLRSDVEVAVSLSGGIDSSVIAVSSAQYLQENIHTYSIVFPENLSIDESKYIKELNAHIKSTPHFITPTAEGFFNDIDELLYSQDIPIWSTSTYNQFLLMKKVKETGIKVILSGQGGDELFAGYQHHYIAYWFSLLSDLNLMKLVRHMKQSQPYVLYPYYLLLKGIVKNFYSPVKRTASKFLSKDILNEYKNNHEHFISNQLDKELIKDLSYRRLKAFLKCEDRCSMWHGVESRLPFSDDINLIQWALQIPAYLKLKNGVGKYVLREAFKNELPVEVYQRKDKKGFEAPLKDWLMLYEKDILHEIKEGWKEILNIQNVKKINTLTYLSKTEIDIVFKLFLLNRWKKVFSKAL